MKTWPTIALLLAALPAQAATTALQCERMFDSRSGRVLQAHTIVVRDGKIAEVLPGRVEVAGAAAIDLGGHTCSPGWTDLHVHLGGQSSPQSYSEGFRLDDVDFAFRSVGYAEKTLLAGFTSVRDLGGDIAPHLRDAINGGLIKGPRIFAAGKSIATTGGHADPSNGLNSELSHLIGPPGPTEGVINSVDDARQAVRRATRRQRRDQITATGGVLSSRKSADAPQFTVEEVRAIVDTPRTTATRFPRMRTAPGHEARGARRRHQHSMAR